MCWSELEGQKNQMWNTKLQNSPSKNFCERRCFWNIVLNSFFHPNFDILLWCLAMLFNSHGSVDHFSGLQWGGFITIKDVSIDTSLIVMNPPHWRPEKWSTDPWELNSIARHQSKMSKFGWKKLFRTMFQKQRLSQKFLEGEFCNFVFHIWFFWPSNSDQHTAAWDFLDN